MRESGNRLFLRATWPSHFSFVPFLGSADTAGWLAYSVQFRRSNRPQGPANNNPPRSARHRTHSPHCFDRLSRWETPARHGPFPWLRPTGSFVCYRYPAYTSSFSPPSARQVQDLSQTFPLLIICNLSLVLLFLCACCMTQKTPSYIHIPTIPDLFPISPSPFFLLTVLTTQVPTPYFRGLHHDPLWMHECQACINIDLFNHFGKIRSSLIIDSKYRSSMILLL